MNASTFVARVIASTGADWSPPACSGAWVHVRSAARRGPARVLKLRCSTRVAGRGRAERTSAALESKQRSWDRPQGFYRAEDPRARVSGAFVRRKSSGRDARGRRRTRKGSQRRAEGAHPGPGDRDECRVLGRRSSCFDFAAGAPTQVHVDVRLAHGPPAGARTFGSRSAPERLIRPRRAIRRAGARPYAKVPGGEKLG